MGTQGRRVPEKIGESNVLVIGKQRIIFNKDEGCSWPPGGSDDGRGLDAGLWRFVKLEAAKAEDRH